MVGVRISLGSVQTCCKAVSAAVAEPAQAIHAEVKQSAEVHVAETGTQGCMLKLASDRAFHLWHQFERKEISRKQLIHRTKPIQDEIRQRLELLRDGTDTTKKARGTAKDLLDWLTRALQGRILEQLIPTGAQSLLIDLADQDNRQGAGERLVDVFEVHAIAFNPA